MTADTSLWTDRPAGDDHAWLAAPAAPPAQPPEMPPAEPGPPAPRPRRHRGLLAGLLALTLIALGALAGALVWGGDDARTPAPVAAIPAATGGRPASTNINDIYAATNKGVVSIKVTSGAATSSGTGFVIDADGTVVTNAHVVEGAQTAQVTFDDAGKPVEGRVLGRDVSSDLAVLHIDASGRTLHPLAFADSAQVKVGDTAVAIGYPLGLDKTATAGIVSGLRRHITAPNGYDIDQVIQTDAPINPGNSGGPLLDTKGRVIGVNSQIATSGAGNGNVGIGFAVPANTVRSVVPQLKAGQTVSHPYLGVATGNALSGSGAQVGTVTPGAPAEKAGIRVGDVIVAVAGKEVAEAEDVAAGISAYKPGDKVDVEVRRGSQHVKLAVTLGTRPASVP